MTDLIVVPQPNPWHKLKALVLDSVSSPITKRVYNLGLDEFFAWYGQEPRAGFSKATVAAWRVALEARGLGAVSINVRITAVRKLAVEAADNSLLAPEIANGITRVKGVASKGVRLGNWLSAKQAQMLLNAPDTSRTKGLRDRAILAVLLGCGLRRSEVAALTFGHVQQRDGRWCIVDLVGKHGRVRTVPMPTWCKVAIDAWTSAAGVADGHVFRVVNRGGKAQAAALNEKVVWQLLRGYSAAAGVPGIAPHDLRRTCAKLCRAAGGELEQIQLLLGHASVQTTERYLSADHWAYLCLGEAYVHAGEESEATQAYTAAIAARAPIEDLRSAAEQISFLATSGVQAAVADAVLNGVLKPFAHASTDSAKQS